MHILEDLFFGNIAPFERSFSRNSQHAKILHEIVAAEEALIAGFTDEQKEHYEKYSDAQGDLMALNACGSFCSGFKLGAKVMLDVLTENELKEI